MPKFKLFIPLFCLLILGGVAFAQDDQTTTTAPPPDINQMVQADENIKPEDLGVDAQTILPDSPLYAFKNLGRGIQSFFTRDPVKKAELKLQFTNERIVEAQKLAEKTDNPDTLNKALDNYKTETDRLKIEVEKIKGDAQDNQNVEKFLDKFIDQNIKQQKIIGELEKDLPSNIYNKIKDVKEDNLAKFSDIALKVALPETIQNKLVENIEAQSGGQFKNFKNLEVLKDIEEKVPGPAKAAIQKAQESTFKKLRGDMEKMSLEDRGKFDDYVKNLGGNEIRHVEIINEFETNEIPDIIREEMEKAKERAFERIDKRMRELGTDKQKEGFLQPLGSGQMEDLRIINELENNLSPETIDKILEIKNQAMKNFKEEVEKTDTPEKMDELLKRAGEFHDVKQFAMFKEMDNLIPEDKKEFWNEIKDTAMQEMKIDIAQAQDMEERKMKFEKLAGDMPQDIEIIKKFGLPPTMITEILKEQVNKLATRIGNTEDAAKLQLLKQTMEQEETIKKELENRNPEIFKKIDVRQEIFQGEITKEKATEQIEKAKQEIVAAENEFSGLDDKTKNEITQRSPYRVLLTNAQKKINVSQVAIENELFGEAFGMATAAFGEANNARRIIKEIGLRREMFEKQDTERIIFEEKFFNQTDQKREVLETKFEQEFRNDRIPLPGEFRIEFLPQEQILQPMMPFPSDQTQAGGQTPTAGGCACIMIWDPVCGKDGRTYGNACEAKCANIEIASKGSCQGEQKPFPMPPMPGMPGGMIPSTMPEFMECASDLSCPQPRCAEGTICPRFKCIDGKCLMEGEGFQKPAELPCAKAGEKVNRNPLLGPTNQLCCEGLTEIQVSKSYSICEKEIRRETLQRPQPGTQPQPEIQPSTGLANPASVYCEKSGYKLEIRTDENGGQYGVCIFRDGNECEEWKFYRGECGEKYRKEERKDGIKCGWCGAVCAEYPLKDGQICPDVMPAPGYQCIEENGQCVTKYTRGEENTTSSQPVKQEESPFQFFKETISNILKPEQQGGGGQPTNQTGQPMQQQPMQQQPR